MGRFLDENKYQFDDENEMAAALGIDFETIEGDYAEAYQRQHHCWDRLDIDVRFNQNIKDNISK